MFQIVQKGWDFLVNPTVRLGVNFPWSLKKIGAAYGMSLLLFILGSFGGPLLLVGLLLLAANYLPLDWAAAVGNFISTPDGKPTAVFMSLMLIISFFPGFLLQISYLRRRLKGDGFSLRNTLALNCDALKGSWWGATLWAVTWRPVLAFGLWLGIDALLGLVLPAPYQATAELAKTFSSGSFLIFGLIAVIGAPLFEETVFRGFLMNGLRASLREGKVFNLLGRSEGWADFFAVVLSAACFALMHLQFNPTTLLMLFLLGCIMGELYRRSGSLYCPMIFHAINNGLAFIILAMGTC